MPTGPIIAGFLIKAGSLMIEAGMKRIIPELSKLIDEPELRELAKDLHIEKNVTKAMLNLANKKG